MRSLAISALQLVVQAASSTGSSPRRPAFLPDQRIDFIFGRYDFSILGFAVIVMLLFTLTRVLKRRRSGTKPLD
ncbi:MAG TPA: hypothetical protein VF850_03795 [Gemmatimonadaceae bacterium]|jgi:endonuclease/exonuclease/phosphatase family metal-dependent hydrolase